MAAEAIDWDALVGAAERAVLSAYAPRSGFRVGAALLTSEGRMAVGCNVENVSYGLTICAERSAVFRAVTDSGNGRLEIVALALATESRKACSPCGACRQVLAEFGLDAAISFVSDQGRLISSVRELIPATFELP